jgi:glycine betaine catabolism B
VAYRVEFKRSGKVLVWNERFENLMDFAEENGIVLDNECHVGVCGSCKVALLSGEVFMEVDDGLDDESPGHNKILPCVAIPKSDIVLDY